MAAPSANPVQLARGTLSFGGTQLGSTRAHVYKPGHRQEAIPAWEWGGSLADKLWLGAIPVFLAVLRTFDSDAVNLIFPSTEVTAGRRRILHKVNDNSAARSGAVLLSSMADVLLWTPLNTTTHQAIKMYAAIPEVEATAEFQFSPLAEFGMPVVFTALPYTDGVQDRMGKLGDLS